MVFTSPDMCGEETAAISLSICATAGGTASARVQVHAPPRCLLCPGRTIPALRG
jgi:hypothetical protein